MLSFSRSPLSQMEEEKREHTIKMKKMEQEMEEVFKMKVQEKKQKLLDSETDVGAEKLLMVVERLACNRNVRSLKAVQHYFPRITIVLVMGTRCAGSTEEFKTSLVASHYIPVIRG